MQTIHWRLGGYAAFILGILMMAFGGALGAPIVVIAIIAALTLSVALVDVMASGLFDRLAYIALVTAALHTRAVTCGDPWVGTDNAFTVMTICACCAAALGCIAWVQDGFRLHPFGASPV